MKKTISKNSLIQVKNVDVETLKKVMEFLENKNPGILKKTIGTIKRVEACKLTMEKKKEALQRELLQADSNFAEDQACLESNLNDCNNRLNELYLNITDLRKKKAGIEAQLKDLGAKRLDIWNKWNALSHHASSNR